MKKIKTLILLILLGFSGGLVAQVSQGGMPLSFQRTSELTKNIDNVFVNPPNMSQIRVEDERNEKNGEMYLVARLMDVEFSMENSGTWDFLLDGTKIWRLSITSEDAKALSLHYNQFYLPKGTKLFLYNANKRQVIGAFTSRNNPTGNRRFSTEIIEGETTTLEYIQPSDVTEKPIINIFKVSYIYRGVEGLIGQYRTNRATNFGASGPCEVNINCPEGNNWQTEKRGVAEIFAVVAEGAGFCTGTLINNTQEDGTPYFLTADHCGGTSQNMDLWEFYFNYETPSCPNPMSEPSYNTISGCTLKSRGPISGGSDFLLVELNETPPSNYNVYYNGWDISTTPASSTIGIHHPSGDIKKISKGGALTSDTYNNCIPNAHWKVVWQATTTNHGVTEAGSSGSPIFNENTKKVVGTLTGGMASCSNQSGPDFYGKLNIHWTENGTTNADRLKPWLDPNNSGVTSLNGWDPNNGGNVDLNAMFNVSQSNIAVGGCVNFQDQSTGNPTSWSWTFDGAQTTTSNQQNPNNICYNTPGTYNVTLEISNGTETDTYTCNNCVTVSNDLNAMFNVSQSNIAVGDCVNFQDQSTGNPTSWSWTFDGAQTTTSNQQNPNNICYNTPGTYDVTLEISNGTQTDTYTCNNCVTVSGQSGDPICAFTANTTLVLAGESVIFTDTSLNGPFIEWNWKFEGGTPSALNIETPVPITYNEVGTYEVELKIRHQDGTQYVCKKQDYITVIPNATELPVVNFIANYTSIQPGGSVNFIDLSANNPYQWEWSFEGGNPSTSNEQNPSNIVYANAGEYQVQLVCLNAQGTDTLVKEAYIIVSENDPCTDAPKAAYKATNRLLSAGDVTYFQDMSTNYPASWSWYFEGGTPLTSNESNTINGIRYNIPGIYNVTLSVTNDCGTDVLVKDEYIYVFSGPVYQYCDTLSNVLGGEVPAKYPLSDTWGFLAGQNGKKIRYYADRFEDYTFSQVEGLVVPVNHSVYGANDSYVMFYIWDGSTEYPDSILAQKKVYIKNLPANFNSVVEFDEPVAVDGPFYAGFRVNYPDTNGDGVSDDNFVVSIAGNRGASEEQNTMYVKRGNNWYTSVEYFNMATSLAIKPVACLVDISEFDIENEIYTYPNPTADYLTVELGEKYRSQNVEITVFDLTGRMLSVNARKYGETEYRIDFSNQTTGIYFVHIRIGDELITKKISVLH